MEDKRKRELEWAKTEVGNLFYRFEAALGRAWVTDCRETASDKSMKRDWDAVNVARTDLLKVIRGW